jgi:uncharacterized protein YbjQ (UPF0145 family)
VIVVNTDYIPGRKISKVLGLVTGSTVRSRHLGKDIKVRLKGLVGGELTDYRELMDDARREALNRMIKEAQKLGADAIINVRFTTAQTMASAAEILVYGTAVKLE